MAKPIFLIGLMGSGKTSLAHYISCHSEVYSQVKDTDQMIMELENSSISDIFLNKGEGYFRNAERQLLEIHHFENTIVATGGGLPCYNDNMNKLLQKGWVVYLKTDPSLLVSRLWENRGNRPLLASCVTREDLEKELKRMQDQRLGYYRQAHLVIENNGDEKKAFEEIQSKITDLS
jgi:shikimate kinase